MAAKKGSKRKFWIGYVNTKTYIRWDYTNLYRLGFLQSDIGFYRATLRLLERYPESPHDAKFWED